MTDIEAISVIGVLTAAFPHARGDDNTVTVYTEALRDLEYELVDRAVRALILTAKWMPAISEIREATIAQRDGLACTGLEAWGAVRRAIGRFGVYRTPGVDFKFDDPIVALVVASIGWSELCNGDIDNQVADRARFIQSYDQIARDHARSRQSGGLLPERVSPRQLARGAEPMQPIRALLQLPAPKNDPWED